VTNDAGKKGKGMQLSALKNMAVVSLADGTKVGAVQDVLVDTTALRVVTLVLDGRSGASRLPFAAISRIGADAVIVEHAALTQGATGQPGTTQVRSLQDLTSLKVVNGDGVFLGEVQEVEFGETDGQVRELVARRGGMLGLGATETRVPVAAIRGIGPQIVTVDMAAPSA
jgi:sporulation protein YlmC with PRC-barrel domain